ncbi:TPA: hypothetical protein SMV99_003332 [Pseudomonas aeruginosa]|nr:hypothetical protein [Pseudomonas aeruginosa]MCS8016450.1 hypothetical protein [Pseudomonas aeruginosa]MCS8020720.1 hypothetical protein [Pseudomonas aeruginosa]MCS9388087.1 hypothetical protein [Pseudomonas aeruginosa]MCS9406424.1 hypothetical protein [Pseudomonas aeruginosa]
MTYALRQPSFVRLKAQLSLNGRFNHALYDAETRQAVHVTLDIERGAGQVHVIVRMGSTLNSLGLPLDSQSNANTVADYIEPIANGRLDTADQTPGRRRFDQAA